MRKLFLLIYMAFALISMAQNSPNIPVKVTDEKLFTEEQVFWSGRDYHNYAVENRLYAWWGDELVRLDRNECFVVNKKTGNEKSFFTRDQIKSWLAPDSTFAKVSLRAVEFPYTDRPLALLKSGEGMALVDFKQGKLVWKMLEKGYVASAWSDKSLNFAFVKDGNLSVRINGSIEGEKPRTVQITNDGDDDNIVYGQAVHRNEWGIESGMFWSPDGKKLAFYRMDQSMVQNYPLPSFLNGNRVQDKKTRYPMAGDVSHKVTIGIYDTDSQQTVYLKAGDPSDRFFTNIQWSPDGKSIYLFEVNRLQNHTQLDVYCAKTGELQKTIYKEDSNKYVEPMTPIVFLPWDESKFVLQTRKDGWNHLYLYDIDGKLVKQITSGEYEVTEFVGFCKSSHSIIYTSRQAGPIYKNLYSVNVDNGKVTALDNGYGIHGGGYNKILSASGKYLFDVWTSHDVPRNIDVVASNGKSVRLFSASNPWAEKHQPIFETGVIKASDGKTDLCYRIVKPYNFDSTKKYPAVVYVYGGPHARNVDDSWHYASRAWETIMSQRGYVCFILDNRGSAERGLEFEQATWHQLGKVEMEDQMKGVEFLKSLPYIDGDRLGVHGWSFGGFMTCSLMTTYPDVFKVGVAGGPVIDWSWYEIMYGERYMGTPQNNPEGYKNSSLLNKAGNLKGRLLVITGGSDPTVVPQNCFNFINAAEQCGKQVDFYVYPDEGHNMAGHKQVTLHKRITQYFEDFLKFRE
ncbi:MAG: DPP IV N-terminal domain-containing protein [Bacteroidaceae bacterium]|nr:DPP IV N-terminal domain-containing protein [Bacteroidaceae bacterium]